MIKENAQHHHHGSSSLSDFILGAQDGLVSVLGLVLGLVASTGNSRVILAGGFAMAIAETISMAGVAYTSNIAKQDLYQAELKNEQNEINNIPKSEEEEIRTIYRNKGFDGKILEDITAHVVANQELWLDTMMREELGMLKTKKSDVSRSTLVVGLSTLAGSVTPLLAFLFLGVHQALIVTFIIAAIFMGIIGAYKAITTVGSPVASAIKMIVIALGSAMAGYLVGLIFKA